MKKVLNFIFNTWTEPRTGKYMDNFCPATGQVFSLLADSGSEDVEIAVSAAKKGFSQWSRLTKQERANWLLKVADELEKNIDEFAELESQDQGKPVHLAKSMDLPRAIANFRFFGTEILHAQNESVDVDGKALNYVLRKPLGVAALISPWNLPLYLLTWKIAPALAAGNAVVCKPSEFTSMTAMRLCQLLQEINFPEGAVNMVFGTGANVGDALVKHPDVRLISFTGGTVTGQKIMAAASLSTKRVGLELGGKNPNIIFADCDFHKAVAMTVRSSFLNQGEICLCGSRIYVEESLFEKFKEALVKATLKIKVGDPRDAANFMGAMVSKAHLEKVESYVELARKEGGQILTGGKRPSLEAPFDQGYYYEPTIITGLDEKSACVQEEIFGPVVTLASFKTRDEVIAKANAVKYGLSATVWTENLSKAHEMAASLDVGTVWINTWMMRDLRVPFGGAKASGLGREGGKHSLDFYSEMTNVCVKF